MRDSCHFKRRDSVFLHALNKITKAEMMSHLAPRATLAGAKMWKNVETWSNMSCYNFKSLQLLPPHVFTS